MRALTDDVREEISTMVIRCYANDCDVKPEEICKETKIQEELGSDSLLLISLLEEATQNYGLEISLSNIGKYINRRPLYTINDVIDTFCKIYKYGNDILKL